MEPSRGAVVGGGRRWGDAEAEVEGDAAEERRPEEGGEVSLREWLDRPGRAVEAAECVHVFRQVAEAVAVAHAQGVAVGSARPSCFVVSPPFARVAFIESASGSDASGSCSGSDASDDADPDASPPRRRDGAARGEDRSGKTFPLKSVLAMELNWYTSPEEAEDSGESGSTTFASDVYRLGVLLFELFCPFETIEEKMRAMANLRHRVLPPQLLLKWPKEASLCQLLMHPAPETRPKMSAAMAEAAAQPYAQVMEVMRKGQELAAQLQGLLTDSPDAGRLVDQILHAMSRTIETARVAVAADEGSERQGEFTCAGTGGGKRKAVGGDKRTDCRRRVQNSSTVTVTVKDIEDGHPWRKYGQKEIRNSKHPMAYFRCTHKYDQHCTAQRQVQRCDDDPDVFRVTYIGVHTCRDPAAAIDADGLHAGSRFISFAPTTTGNTSNQQGDHRQNTPPTSPESSRLTKEANWRPPRPRMVAYATSSSTSGSIFTSYTSGSSQQQSSDRGGSPLPATLSTRLVEEIASKLEHVQFPCLELEEETEKTSGHIKSLVQEFCTTSNSALVLERWFSDLGVSWVLSINEDFPRELQHFARSWIAALAVIQVFIFTYLDGSHNPEDGKLSPSASEFARFIQSTFSKMLPFVDAIVAPNAIIDSASVEQTMSSNGEATEPAEEKLQPLLGVRDALSAVSEQIQLWPHCPPFVGSGGIIDEVSKLLSAKLGKLDEAVWDTVDEIRTSLTKADSEAQQRSPDVIHLVTRSITHCIKVLSTNYRLANQIVSKAASLGKYVPDQAAKISHLVNTDGDAFAVLIMEMLSCLQEKLSQLSKSFSDQSLQFLFLLNNTYFMWQQLHPSSSLESHMPALTCKIDEHMQSYLQASWAPVMSCLHDPTPLCLGRYSPLAKFRLEFQKTSTAQMLWKVPDPELKRRLRKAIIDKVHSGFTKYLEDYNIITPKVTPQELEETLQQLFEG